MDMVVDMMIYRSQKILEKWTTRRGPAFIREKMKNLFDAISEISGAEQPGSQIYVSTYDSANRLCNPEMV